MAITQDRLIRLIEIAELSEETQQAQDRLIVSCLKSMAEGTLTPADFGRIYAEFRHDSRLPPEMWADLQLEKRYFQKTARKNEKLKIAKRAYRQAHGAKPQDQSQAQAPNHAPNLGPDFDQELEKIWLANQQALAVETAANLPPGITIQPDPQATGEDFDPEELT